MASSSSEDGWEDSQMHKPSLMKYNVHTPFQDFTTEENRRYASNFALPVSLCLLNFDGNSNIAMSIRSAAVFGIREVFILGKRKYDRRATVGAQNYIQLHRLPMPDDPKAFFEARGLVPILVEQGGQSLEEMDFRPYLAKPVVFIMGSEGEGISPEWLRSLADCPRVSISQYGLIRSMNVSIAASILLYEFLKQWREKRRAVLTLM